MRKKIEELQVTISAEEYIRRFRDVPRFLELCKACGNYGQCWACPPFNKDWTQEMLEYERVTLFVTKIEPQEAGLTLSEVAPLFREERMRIEPRLRELEKQTGGLAFAFAGECLYCPTGTCTRKEGKPCRHPDLVRPSLEAVGFDLGKTAAELFNLPILWSTDGLAPRYLLLICGLFHNQGFQIGI